MYIGRIEPLCGEKWLKKHQNDYSQEYIDSLGIEVSIDGKRLSSLTLSPADNEKRKQVKVIMESSRP